MCNVVLTRCLSISFQSLGLWDITQTDIDLCLPAKSEKLEKTERKDKDLQSSMSSVKTAVNTNEDLLVPKTDQPEAQDMVLRRRATVDSANGSEIIEYEPVLDDLNLEIKERFGAVCETSKKSYVN